MNKYKEGDKIVLEIISGEAYGDYLAGSKEQNWWFNAEGLERGSEPLSNYTEPLEAKIRRQAAEITRLLAENKELKEDFEKSKRVNLNMGRVAGQNEAWNLARKIFSMEANDIEDIFIKTSAWNLSNVLDDYTYQEAAAKVAEWEKIKEIKVGDVVSREGLYGVVKSVSDNWLNGITASGISFQWLKRKCTKTGRHIDIDGFLKQIGGNGNER